MRSLSAFVALSVVASVYARFPRTLGPFADVYIANRNIQPDGFLRGAVLAGATADTVTFPGPLIQGVKGDRFNLNVVNQLTNTTMLTSTSIHWHGLFQEGSSWADGPVGVTQCPIIPGDSFNYRFRVPDQAGTFWYHSHDSTQYCDGLRGPMVVYDPRDPHIDKYDFDDESTIITLADWYHVPAPIAQQGFPKIESTLINGLGRYENGPSSPLAVINVQFGARYRFRLVSISCDPNFVFSIDGHSMTIIEADGVNTQPLTVDSIQIFAGQRYSFVLTARQPVGNYWIRSEPNLGPKGFVNGVNSAILRYRGAPRVDPTTQPTVPKQPLLETNLHPLVNPLAPGIPRPGAADVNLNLQIGFNATARKFTVNNATFDPPTRPVLLQILSGAKTPTDLLPAGSVYVLPPNKVIELVIPGGSIGTPHPMHLHGHVFSVVRSAGSSTYNFINPVQRDVVNVGVVGDLTTIRFATDNAGPWILHCHIDWHLELGLAVVFAEDVGKIAKSNPPDAWDDLCPAYNDWVATQPGHP